MPTAIRPQSELIADAGAALIDWDGTEAEEVEDYDAYIASRPPKEAMRPYKTPVYYWEVKYPGCALQPYPRLAPFESLRTGLWTARNQWQEDAIRDHIRRETGFDPDDMKISADEWAVMSGQARKGLAIRFCQDCKFISCSMEAVNAHERLCGHRTDQLPRKD
jgi:hypothetical protein